MFQKKRIWFNRITEYCPAQNKLNLDRKDWNKAIELLSYGCSQCTWPSSLFDSFDSFIWPTNNTDQTHFWIDSIIIITIIITIFYLRTKKNPRWPFIHIETDEDDDDDRSYSINFCSVFFPFDFFTYHSRSERVGQSSERENYRLRLIEQSRTFRQCVFQAFPRLSKFTFFSFKTQPNRKFFFWPTFFHQLIHPLIIIIILRMMIP